MSAVLLTKNDHYKSEMGYHDYFQHTLGWIYKNFYLDKIEICYTACHMINRSVSPTIPGFQGLKRCIQHMTSHPNKPIFILQVIIIDQISQD